MSGALAFLAGAIVGGLFVLGAGWFLVLAGSRRADRGVGWIFAGSGLLLLVGVGGGQPAVVGAGAGALAGSVGLVLWSGRKERRLDRRAMSVAQGLGLAFADQPSDELRNVVPGLLPAGDRHEIRRILSGSWRGHAVMLFEYSVDNDGSVFWNFDCAFAPAPVDGEPVFIGKETFMSRMNARLGDRDIEFGEPDFDQRFLINSKDPDRARSLLGPSVRSWLLSHDEKVDFRVGRGGVMCVCDRGATSPERLLDLTTDFLVALFPTLAETVAVRTAVPRISRERDVFPAQPRSSSPGRAIIKGLAIAVLVAIVGAVAFYALFWFACATGQGCL